MFSRTFFSLILLLEEDKQVCEDEQAGKGCTWSWLHVSTWGCLLWLVLETDEGCLIVLFFCLNCLLVLVLGDQLLSKLSLPLTVPRQKTPYTNQSQQQKLCLLKVGRGWGYYNKKQNLHCSLLGLLSLSYQNFIFEIFWIQLSINLADRAFNYLHLNF